MANPPSESSLYSPEVAMQESPREGGFLAKEDSLPQSTAVLKKHIKELYAQVMN